MRLISMHCEARLIAMLDVLGFSNLTDTPTKIIETLDQYTELIAQARDHILISRSSDESNRTLDFHSFAAAEFAFDTLVLVSLPCNAVNVGSFIAALCNLMSHFAVNGMPLRGAIGIGDYAVNEKRADCRIASTTISKQLITAEARQDWSGCYVLPEFSDQVLAYLAAEPSELAFQSTALLRYPVPLKKRDPVVALCLNWSAGMSTNEICELLKPMTEFSEKYANTRKFVAFVKGLPESRYPLPPNFLPAVSATVLHSGPGISIYFWNEDGTRASRLGCRHVIFDPKRPRQDAFRGYDTDAHERELAQSW